MQNNQPNDITDSQALILKHSLTGGNEAGRVYRNRYAVGPGGYAWSDVQALSALGLMRLVGEPEPDKSVRLFKVTDAGAKAVGLKLPDDER